MLKRLMMVAGFIAATLAVGLAPAKAQLLMFSGTGTLLGSSQIDATPIASGTLLSFEAVFNPTLNFDPATSEGAYYCDFLFHISGVGDYRTQPGNGMCVGFADFGGGAFGAFVLQEIAPLSFTGSGTLFLGSTNPTFDVKNPTPTVFTTPLAPFFGPPIIANVTGGSTLTLDGLQITSAQVTNAPEASSIAMMVFGLAAPGMAVLRNRRKAKA